MTTPSAPASVPTENNGSLPATPPLTEAALDVARRGKWGLSSTPETGAVLRALAASKPGGRFLELGAGVGAGAGWLLDGMDDTSKLTTIELFPGLARACAGVLEHDTRVTVVNEDVIDWLGAYDGPRFDFVFVDTTSAKFDHLDLVVEILAEGGLMVADDLLPQPKWTDEHPARVNALRENVMADPRLAAVLVDWASGLLVAARRPQA